MKVSLDQARQAVLGRCRPIELVEIDLNAARALILTEEIRAAAPVPGFTNNAIDGFAARSIDVTTADTLAAGDAPDITIGESNPAAAILFEVFDPPAIRRLQGCGAVETPLFPAVLAKDDTRPRGDHFHFVKVALTPAHRSKPRCPQPWPERTR